MNQPQPPEKPLLDQIEQAVQQQQLTGQATIDRLNHLRPLPPRTFQDQLEARLLRQYQPQEETMQAVQPVYPLRRINLIGVAALVAVLLLGILFINRPRSQVAWMPIAQEATATPTPMLAESIDVQVPVSLQGIMSPLARIEGGLFQMGTNPAEVVSAVSECQTEWNANCELNWGEDSVPQHPVRISPFDIETHEVSYRQYLAFLNWLGPNRHLDGCLGQSCILIDPDELASDVQFENGRYQIDDAFLNFPVVGVTWYGAQAYCEAIDRRLPTEAEWEHAARTGENFFYPWGNVFDASLARTSRPLEANMDLIGAREIESYPPNAFGLYDMAGNVAEWVWDWYRATEYIERSRQAETDDPVGPLSGDEKVVRGGSWDSLPFFARSVHRQMRPPDAPANWIGFRCVQGKPINASVTNHTSAQAVQLPADRVAVSLPLSDTTRIVAEEVIVVGDRVDVYGADGAIERLAEQAQVVAIEPFFIDGDTQGTVTPVPRTLITLAVLPLEATRLTIALEAGQSLAFVKVIPDQQNLSPVVMTSRNIIWGTSAAQAIQAFVTVYLPADQIPADAVRSVDAIEDQYLTRSLNAWELVQSADFRDESYPSGLIPNGMGATEIPLSRIANDISDLQPWTPVQIQLTVFLAENYLTIRLPAVRILRNGKSIGGATEPFVSFVLPQTEMILFSRLIAEGAEEFSLLTVTPLDDAAEEPSGLDTFGNVVEFAPGEEGSCGQVAAGPSIDFWGNPMSEGPVTTGFSANHPGIDFEGPEGNVVRATSLGKVLFAGYSSWGYGNVVALSHGPFISLYAHLGSILVQCGELVQAGDPVGTLGSTGNSSGPHLHFEIRLDGLPLDPLLFLPQLAEPE